MSFEGRALDRETSEMIFSTATSILRLRLHPHVEGRDPSVLPFLPTLV